MNGGSSSTRPAARTLHPYEFFAPGWHPEGLTPVVNNRYVDRGTGEIRETADRRRYAGPPYVDVIITNLHEDTVHYQYRAARAFPMEVLLCHMVGVVARLKLHVDSILATAYAIRIVLSHDLTLNSFNNVVHEMASGIWDLRNMSRTGEVGDGTEEESQSTGSTSSGPVHQTTGTSSTENQQVSTAAC